MLARYMLSHLPVCHDSQADTVPMWPNAGSRKQRRTIAQGLYAKDLGEIPTGLPLLGYQIEVGSVTIGDFRPICRYISETVQHRDITMEC